MMETIDHTNEHFKGQMKTEEVLCFTRRHWVKIFPYLILTVLWPFLIGLYLIFGSKPIANFLGQTAYHIFTLALILILTFFLHRTYIQIFNFYLSVIIITNYRLIDLDKTVFFKSNQNAIDLKEVQDATLQRSGFLQTVLNYGIINIMLSSVTEPVVMRYVPNPEYYFRKINKTKREYILGRQVEKKATEHFALDRELKPLTEETQYPLTEQDIHGKSNTG